MAVVLVVAACGRIGFDNLGPSATAARANICAGCASMSVTLDSIPSGSALVAFVATCMPPTNCVVPQITDDANSTWGAPFETTDVHNALFVWVACTTHATSDTVVVTTSAQQFLSLHVVAVVGGAASGCLEATGSASGSAPDTLGVATDSAVMRVPSYAFAFFLCHDGTGTCAPWTPETTFTVETTLVAPFAFHSTLLEVTTVEQAGAPATASASQTDTGESLGAIAVLAPP